jgi:hypothetical protein
MMQKITTRVFITSSILFGITGLALVMTVPSDGQDTALKLVLIRVLFANVCIILTSFALSVANKYLKEKSQ